MDSDSHRAFVLAIIGLHPDHQRLYLNSPYFRHAVDGLVNLLEPMIQGLADAAEVNDAKIMQMTEILRTGTLYDSPPKDL